MFFANQSTNSIEYEINTKKMIIFTCFFKITEKSIKYNVIYLCVFRNGNCL